MPSSREAEIQDNSGIPFGQGNYGQLLKKLLKDKKYLIMFIKDMQPKEDHDNMLHADVVRKLSEIECLKFKGYKVWFDHTQILFPLGYPYAFVANIFHQFINKAFN